MEGLVVVTPSDSVVFDVEAIGKASVARLILESQVRERVLFKVKTTAPERYDARPTVGILQDRQSLELALTLASGGIRGTEGVKDKFLVQVVVAPDALPETPSDEQIKQAWKDVPANVVHSKKIAVVINLPPQANVEQEQTEGSGASAERAEFDLETQQEVWMLEKRLEKIQTEKAEFQKQIDVLVEHEQQLRGEEAKKAEGGELVGIPLEQCIIMLLLSIMSIILFLPTGDSMM